MKFVVDYRGPDGSRQQKEIEAADRAAVFAELKKLGISAITVREGILSKKSSSTSPSLVKGIVAGLVVVIALAGVLYLVLGNRDEKPQEEKTEKTKLIKEVAPSVMALTNNIEKVVEIEKKVPPPQRFGKHVVEVDEDGQRWITRNGRRRKLVSVKTGTSKQLFFNLAENQISALVTVKPGDMIVGFDVDERFVKNFVESLKNEIEFSDDDTPEERQEKELVKEAKQNLKEYMEQGQDIVEIMKDEYKKIAKLNALKTDLMNDLSKMRREGASADDIDIQVRSSNELLKRYGVEHEFKLLRRERILLDESDYSSKPEIHEEIAE